MFKVYLKWSTTVLKRRTNCYNLFTSINKLYGAIRAVNRFTFQEYTISGLKVKGGLMSKRERMTYAVIVLTFIAIFTKVMDGAIGAGLVSSVVLYYMGNRAISDKKDA